MHTQQSDAAYIKNTTVTVEDDGRVEIQCRRGLWSVSAPNMEQASAEARQSFAQYYSDGEYDD
jgi:hypothetical protein